MLSAYPACFFQEDDGYSVVFPDLNWLSTCGTTLDEVFGRAVDSLAGYLYMAKRDGEQFPKPSEMAKVDLAAIAGELEASVDRAFVNMVTVDVEEYAKAHFEKSVKKTLTIPVWLNDAAVQNGVNFSQVLQKALMEQLKLS